MVASIVKEINIRKDFFNKDKNQSPIIETIYFGGGTPSLLDIKEFELIIQSINENYNIDKAVEITLEANPDDLSKDYLKALKGVGVNRLSIGIQSFNDKLLTYMHRAHSADEAKKAIKDSISAGFESINIDLIYGIPDLTNEGWEAEMNTATDFPINHISCYGLTVEPKTALNHFIKNKKYAPLNEAKMVKQFLSASTFLATKGFTHYEISNYALNKQYSKHNTAYWKKEAYLGVGPSAHSYINSTRSWNVANNSLYIKSIAQDLAFSETENLSKKDQFNEHLLTGLRTIWGIDLNYIGDKFGLPYKKHLLKALTLLKPSFFELKNQDIVLLSKEGWLWSDSILQELFYG